MIITKNIFGKNYSFKCANSFSSTLIPSIDLYPEGDPSNIHVIVEIHDDLPTRSFLSNNPSEFFKAKNSVDFKYYKGRVRWTRNEENDMLHVHLSYSTTKFGLIATFRKFRSMEFSTDVEEFQQILHEVVLVPSVYLLPDRAIVHSSVMSVDGNAIMLAGTGGVGKTSAALSLRNNERVSFIADDIAIISPEGLVYSNLAWPKVYGYNLSSHISKQELLKGRSLIDKIQFNCKVSSNPKKVRRKMKPNLLYKRYQDTNSKLKTVFYLFRDHSTNIHTTSLKEEDAIEMGLHVMRTEYNKILHNNFEWDSYNSIASKIDPFVKLEDVFDNWRHVLNCAFENVDIQLLHIPFNLPHEEYLREIHKYILD